MSHNLSQAQCAALSKLAQPGWFLKRRDGMTQWRFYRRGETVEDRGPLHSAATFARLRERGLIEPEPQSASRRWVISDRGRDVRATDFMLRVAEEGPEVEYTDLHGGY